MAIRHTFGCLLAIGFVVSGCKDDASKTKTAGLDKQCEQLANTCGDKDKHIDKLIDECKQAAKKHVDKGCGDKLESLHACYAKEVCGGTEKVWALDDLRVLANRHEKCMIQRADARSCIDK
jgi:hypothetical protein